MIRLSVNVNKVATLRNSRGGAVPSVLEAVRVFSAPARRGSPCIRGPTRVTSPRPTCARSPRADVVARGAPAARPDAPIELNIEGDPRPDLMALVHEVRPDQCTLVPVLRGEITSQGRLAADQAGESLAAHRGRAQGGRDPGQRVRRPGRRAGPLGGRRRAPTGSSCSPSRSRGRSSAVRDEAAACARRLCPRRRARARLGLGVNAGHDLDLDNLVLFRELPHLAEVSIGHALISRALFVGLDATRPRVPGRARFEMIVRGSDGVAPGPGAEL